MTEPVVEKRQADESGCVATMSFPRGSDFFDGHFEGAPVLPGVVQTGAAARELERLLGHPVRVREIRKLKFAKVVHPGDSVIFSLSRKSDAEWAFRYESDGQLCSSGILVAE